MDAITSFLPTIWPLERSPWTFKVRVQYSDLLLIKINKWKCSKEDVSLLYEGAHIKVWRTERQTDWQKLSLSAHAANTITFFLGKTNDRWLKLNKPHKFVIFVCSTNLLIEIFPQSFALTVLMWYHKVITDIKKKPMKYMPQGLANRAGY